MNVNLSKREIIDMIKSIPVSYGRYTKELNEAGEWKFNMDGPTHFVWNITLLLTKSEEYLYEFYQKLYRGDYYLHDEEIKVNPQPVELPLLRRMFPVLGQRQIKRWL